MVTPLLQPDQNCYLIFSFLEIYAHSELDAGNTCKKKKSNSQDKNIFTTELLVLLHMLS